MRGLADWEVAAVLAGLRLLQESKTLPASFDHFDDVERPTADMLDTLCGEIQLDGVYIVERQREEAELVRDASPRSWQPSERK